MRMPVGEGKLRDTHRGHLEAAARQGDPEAEWELANHPDPPEITEHLWGYYCALERSRPITGMGPSRIPRAEIRAWEAGQGFKLQPWEETAILTLDTIWVNGQLEQIEAERPKGKN